MRLPEASCKACHTGLRTEIRRCNSPVCSNIRESGRLRFLKKLRSQGCHDAEVCIQLIGATTCDSRQNVFSELLRLVLLKCLEVARSFSTVRQHCRCLCAAHIKKRAPRIDPRAGAWLWLCDKMRRGLVEAFCLLFARSPGKACSARLENRSLTRPIH